MRTGRIASFSIFFIPVSCFSSVTISPSTPTVVISSNVTLTTTQTVTWSLLAGSTGTLSGATGTSVVYNAPGPGITAQNVWLGNPLLPNDHIYNTRIDTCPVLTSTNTYFHNHVADGTVIGMETEFPENIINLQTPTTSFVFVNSGVNGSYPLLGFPDLAVEHGIFSDNRTNDHHILEMSTDSGKVTELYQFYNVGGNVSCPTCNSGSGVQFINDYALNQGVDAAGMYVSPLLVRFSELKACANGNGTPPINHALRMTLSVGVLAPSHVWPATAQASDGGQIPFGSRLRLKASVSISTYPAAAQCVLTALKQYGAFVVDGGINMHFSTTEDAPGDYLTWSSLTDDLGAGNNVTASNFEFIDESTLEDTNSASPTYQTGRVDPSNAFSTPATFAVVIASNTTTHESSKMPIIVQPVTIGVDRSVGYSFMAGAPATQLGLIVRGSTTTTPSCSMSPTLGSLTSAGLYTPPTSSTSRSSATVTCTAVADSTATISFPVIVYSTAAIRERYRNGYSGTNVDYGPDANGNTWYYNLGDFWTLTGQANCDWSGDSWSGVTDSGLYKFCQFINKDNRHKFIVPNGTYQVTMKYGIGTPAYSTSTWKSAIDYNGTQFTAFPATYTLTGYGPWTGLGLTENYFSVCGVVGNCATDTPGSITFNVSVSTNQLNIVNRQIDINGDVGGNNVLTALEVVPVAAASTGPSQSCQGGIKFQGGITGQ